jgi:iron complex transport system substrate-binding protein
MDVKNNMNRKRDRVADLTASSRRQMLAGIAAFMVAPALAGTRVIAAEDDLRFVHVYGETVLPQPAKRIVSLGYVTQDPLLALGVVPVGIREWYGARPYAVWPWAQSLLGNAQPEVIQGEVSAEIVAALNPDLIIGIGSGISKAEYEVLSQIAPVLMQSVGQPTYGMPWDQVVELLGRAVGKAALAEQLIAGNRTKFAATRQRHPEWEGKTAVCAYNSGSETGAFIGSDTRATFLAELGFRPPRTLADLSTPEGFYAPLSPEDLSPLDADLLIWVSSSPSVADIAALPMRRTLRAYREGREIVTNELIAGALSFGSVLSLPFALEQLEAEITTAIDGLPDTKVPSSVKTGLAP